MNQRAGRSFRNDFASCCKLTRKFTAILILSHITRGRRTRLSYICKCSKRVCVVKNNSAQKAAKNYNFLLCHKQMEVTCKMLAGILRWQLVLLILWLVCSTGEAALCSNQDVNSQLNVLLKQNCRDYSVGRHTEFLKHDCWQVWEGGNRSASVTVKIFARTYIILDIT